MRPLVFFALIYVLATTLAAAGAIQPPTETTVIRQEVPEWQTLVQTFGAPGAFGALIIFILRKVSGFLETERAVNKAHQTELLAARDQLIGNILQGAKDVAEENCKTTDNLRGVGQSLSEVTLHSRELVRDLTQARSMWTAPKT